MHYELQIRRYRRFFRKPLITSRFTLDEREGLIIRLENEEGKVGFGEVAPMEFLGTETLEDAKAFCVGIGDVVDDEYIRSIDSKMGCCRFALESAQEMMRMVDGLVIDREFEVAGLLSLGEEAEALLGYKTFKCKIGKDVFEKEKEAFLHLKDRLPEGAVLRLDANGSFSVEEAEEWLKFLEIEVCNVQFLEQPLPKGEEQLMSKLSRDYSIPIALDESIVNIEDMERVVDSGWPGWLVVKPALIGDLVRFRNLREKCEVPIVYSSIFETEIGMEAALRVAASDDRNHYALGFGTNTYFYEDGFNRYPVGPLIQSSIGSGLEKGNVFERIWRLCQSVS